MDQKRQIKNKQKIIDRLLIVLLVILIIAASKIIWIVVPVMAGEKFGAASQNLSGSQKWIYSEQLLFHQNNLLNPNCSDSRSVVFTINLGDSVDTIASHLKATGLITNEKLFRTLLIYKGIDSKIRAGDYELTCANAPVSIAEEIKNKYLESVVFNILPGWRFEQIADALSSSGIGVSSQDFLTIVKNPSGLQLPSYIPQGKSLEGFLFPGEYTIDRDTTPRELVQKFINRFDQEITSAGITTGDKNNLNFYQMVTMASIIQKETNDDDEKAMIASVFYNRLSDNMKLQTDPTVQYSIGYNAEWGWWKTSLTVDDLTVDSEYNTYLISGLPPTPISNPNLASIKAAVNPSESNYFYFRAKCDDSGTHNFSQTYDQQLANACN